MSETRKKEFSYRLLHWWDLNKADYPWRKTKDPFSVLIAELLLRKTTSKQVEKMYLSFLKKYPTPIQLADASEDDLRQLLSGLGMENIRSRLLKKTADAILKEFDGKIPPIEERLTLLPGVGKYSANAVLCMAYGADVPMVDTNAIRVVQRVFSFSSSKARAKDDFELWNFVKMLIPTNKGREFNLAIIDFAHAVCLPKKPHCWECLLKDNCDYGKHNCIRL